MASLWNVMEGLTGRALSVLQRATEAVRPVNRGFMFLWNRLPHVRVNQDTVLTISTVWRCVNFIGGNIAQLPWNVHQGKNDNGKTLRRPDHPTDRLLNRRASREMGAYMFREVMLIRALLFGNAYAEIERDQANRAINLWPIDTSRVQVDRDENGELIYVVTNIGAERTIIPAMNMFHLPGPGYDGIVGYPVIEYAARCMGLAIAAEEYGGSFFGNSGVPSGILEHPGMMSEPARKRLEDDWRKNRSGPRQSQRTIILEEGMAYKPIAIPPEQAQFLGTRNFGVVEVCRWFGVPPPKVGHLDKASYNTVEQLGIQVVVDTLMPWIKKLEQEADAKLLTGNYAGLYTKIDVRGLMRGTHADRAAYYRTMFMIGTMSINDIRRLEDMDPVKNGDINFVPLNIAPLDKVASGEAGLGAVINPPKPTGVRDPTTEGAPAGEGGQTPPAAQQVTVAQQFAMRLLEATLHDLDEVNGGQHNGNGAISSVPALVYDGSGDEPVN